ncbi:FtsW/RodA/SpoVE family cell cycle protein, partial [Patescibacteria group bacterium]
LLVSRKTKSAKLVLGLGGISLLVGLVFIQPDLGSSLVLALVGLSLISLWSERRQVLILGLIFLASLGGGWLVLKDYQKVRLFSFLGGSTDTLGADYHRIQAMVAVGSGRFWGRGLFRGTQSQLKFLPEKHTDFIYAALSEELGFWGAAGVLLIFFFLLAQILVVASKSKDLFGRLICLGVFVWLGLQVLVNIGMNLGVLPITGLTLPLVSSGGSSVVSVLIGLGLVESVSFYNQDQRTLEIH